MFPAILLQYALLRSAVYRHRNQIKQTRNDVLLHRDVNSGVAGFPLRPGRIMKNAALTEMRNLKKNLLKFLSLYLNSLKFSAHQKSLLFI